LQQLHLGKISVAGSANVAVIDEQNAVQTVVDIKACPAGIVVANRLFRSGDALVITRGEGASDEEVPILLIGRRTSRMETLRVDDELQILPEELQLHDPPAKVRVYTFESS
jgi:hypothetical protein